MKKRIVTLLRGSSEVLVLEWRPWRKKPVIVQAVKLEVPFKVETLEGVMEGSAGDWLIEGIEGELYPCKDSIFRATYEEV